MHTTDRIFQLAAGSEWFLAFLRTNVLPPIAKYILSLDTVKHFVFLLLSQTGINYRHGSLSRHAGDENFKVKAGDRMPYFLIDGASIYDKLHQPKFHLLFFSDAQSDFQALKTELENEYAESVDFHFIPLYPQIVEIFGTDKSFNVLLRPDNYISFISQENSSGELRSYLNKLSEIRKIKQHLSINGRQNKLLDVRARTATLRKRRSLTFLIYVFLVSARANPIV